MNDTGSEEWRAIPGTDGFYEVSDAGRVRSWHKRGTRGNARAEIPQALRPALWRGYPRVCIVETEHGKRTRLVHRLVAVAFLGPCPEGQEVRHLDGNPANTALTNLAYGTSSENAQDSIRHGTFHSPFQGVTHCVHGHAFDEENTYFSKLGRECRECNRRRNRESRARRRAERETG